MKNIKILDYFALIKISHTIFAMPFALIGFFFAIRHEHHAFHWSLFLLCLACLLFARSAAMSFNRFSDRIYDSKNIRTQQREIPTKKISQLAALFFAIANSLLFIITTWFINSLCFYLSPVALLVILGYSLTKRFTMLCHFVLGLGLALAPIGAFITVTAYFAWIPICLSFAVLFWVTGFDIIYALQDISFDHQEKLHSIPAFFGKKNALLIAKVVHTLTAILIISIGVIGHFQTLFYIGAFIFCCLLIYQHFIVKPSDLSKVNIAFFTLNGIASLIFGLFTIADLYYPF